MMREHQKHFEDVTRRHFMGRCTTGVGALALGCLLGDVRLGAASTTAVNPLAAKPPHFAARAKHVIYLHMAGSPPQHELFDYKPELVKHNRQPCPAEYLKGERFAFIRGTPKLLGPSYKFAKQGQCGTEVSELLPHLSRVIDEIAIVKTFRTNQFNHAPAQLLLHTGDARFGKPSMGAWVTYGIGSESENLPGFVVLVSGGKLISAGKSAWASGFLPGVYQGVQCRSGAEPILYVNNPRGMDRRLRRSTLDALGDLNRLGHQRTSDPETLTRIAQYELAFRMQMSVPEAMDIAQEPNHIHKMYGAEPGRASFANNCLLARRMVERGVRFVELFDWGWDVHGTAKDNDIVNHLPKKCRQTDRPIAALIADLKQRGLLEETLIVWSGEFGRTPMNEERNGSKLLGRDHHPHCATIWMAGGGIKGGQVHGETDELGYFIVKDELHVHDLQATILYLLGLDHERLTFPFQGLDQRLTSITRKSTVRHQLLA